MKRGSIFSNLNLNRRVHDLLSDGISRHAWYLATAGIVLVVSALYLGGATRCEGLGFPLDDAWIHQTYARNLAQSGQLAYVPGQTSAGSTSLLWTLLLALGYVVGVVPVLWAYVLGAISWLLVSWTSAALAGRLFPQQRRVAPLMGLACLLEWHLAWAAFSGMEITLFTFLSLLLMERYAAGMRPFALGLIGGLLVLARPEGILLVGLLTLAVVLDAIAFRRRRVTWLNGLSSLADLAAGMAALLVPYVVLNGLISGKPLPNTLYAKQAEYRALLAQPLWSRLWIVVRRPLVGAQALLIPGFVWQAIREAQQMFHMASRARRPDRSVPAQGAEAPPMESRPVFLGLLPVVWWAVHHAIYAWRLPVDYQYGRYLMPAVPVLLLYGIAGTVQWLQRPAAMGPRSRLAARVLGRALILAAGCLFVAFLVLGGRAYAEDLCIINGEMVHVALWLRANTPPDALVAAHDLGALGYFAQRPLLDLAGLIAPELIPVIRDEARLLEFAVERGAEYLVTFPSWYPEMVADDRLTLVYQTGCQVTRQRGGENMAVYRIGR